MNLSIRKITRMEYLICALSVIAIGIRLNKTMKAPAYRAALQRSVVLSLYFDMGKN